MGKGSKNVVCKSTSHRLFKDRAKNRVDDLQGMFSDLQVARKESRTVEVALLEEQLHQMLREWKTELNQPSPASSLQGGSIGPFSSDICRLLQICEEEDDATSALTAPKPEPNGHKAGLAAFTEGSSLVELHQEQRSPLVNHNQSSVTGINIESDNINLHSAGINNLNHANHLDYHAFNLPPYYDHRFFPALDDPSYFVEDGMLQMPHFADDMCPPPSAFLGPKCALWDCPRPARVWCQKFQDYCSDYHQALAPNEGYLGMTPVLRPGGIGLKDSLLFAALSAKSQSKEVGIPECEGAATAKSPWNAPELFDLEVLEGEIIREWLFFDKPRRAFESGNRKQRSLPDYNGRGWHESRKQVMNEFAGLKRSYYMDPQPIEYYEWHLYEYEISKYNACALYRLELKFVDKKKGPKGKISTDSVADLQKQMGRLTAEFQPDNKRSTKARGKSNAKDGVTNEELDLGASVRYEDYLVDNLNGYYGT